MAKKAKINDAFQAFENIIATYRDLQNTLGSQAGKHSSSLYFYQHQFSAEDWKILCDLQNAMTAQEMNEKTQAFIKTAKPALELLAAIELKGSKNV